MLLLDSEALSRLARGRAERRARVRALLLEARRREETVATSASVLAEVIRGRPADAEVFSSLRRDGVDVRPVDMRTGVRAGQLLGAVGAGSELAVDAFLVATADLSGGAVIATVDPDDLRRLAAHTDRIVIVEI